jgi:hypothetical protein
LQAAFDHRRAGSTIERGLRTMRRLSSSGASRRGAKRH